MELNPPILARVRAEGQGERGSMALLLAVFILPVLFFIFSVSTDVALFLTNLQKVQKLVDDAALYGYRFMPYDEPARAATCAFLARHSSEALPLQCGENVHVEIPADHSALTISVAAHHPLTLAQYFGVDVALPVEAYAMARGRPFDTLIVLDVGPYLAPPVPDGTPWGSPGEWPASQFSALISLGHDQRLLTQQCVNPVLAPLKYAAIYAYEYLAMNGLNAVGVAFSPGGENFLDIARAVLPRGAGHDQINLPAHEYPFRHNTYCLGVGEYDPPGSPNAFPQPSAEMSWAAEDDPYRPSPIIIPSPPEHWALNEDYRPYFRTREVIWGQSARHDDSHVNIGETLRSIRSAIVGSQFDGERGGMARAVPKNIVFFAGDVPRIGATRFQGDNIVAQALRSELEALRAAAIAYDMNITFTYVLLEHSYLSFGSESEALGELFDSVDGVGGATSGSFRVHLLRGVNGPELAQEAASNLILEGRRVVLAK